jgi:amino acid transporter
MERGTVQCTGQGALVDKPANPPSQSDDAAQLAALGYTSEFKREMSLWSNFALGFLYLSPVVGVYTMFGFGSSFMGGLVWLPLVVAGFGQLLVATVFGEVVSQFPVAGGLYPWTRRLWGKKYAWLTSWVYMWAIVATIAGVVYGAGPYIAWLLGFTASAGSTVICALILLAIATVINFMGTKVLSVIARIAFVCELTGCLIVGVLLLTIGRHGGISTLFHTFGAGKPGSYFPAFATGALIGLWVYYGFEACGDVAEEVPNASRVIPKAMRRTIYVGGAASTFITVSFILSVSNWADVISGKETDPVGTALSGAFGTVGMKIVLFVVLISFLSCAMSLQAAGSRLMYSYGRDRMIFGHRFFSKFNEKRHVPQYAMGIAGLLPAIVVLISLFSTNALAKIIAFASCGIYCAFTMVTIAALRARLKGWQPDGRFTMGSWGLLITSAAIAYQFIAILDMCYPHYANVSWLDNYIVILGLVIVFGIGIVYMALGRPWGTSTAPSSDAIALHHRKAANVVQPVQPQLGAEESS